MKSRKTLLGTSALLVGAALLYLGWLAVRARSNLVTLNVRNMDVRQVVTKIEWQTWELISVHKEVQGPVTLNVRRMPLEQVLRLVGDQTASRSSVIYPLYSSGKSLVSLKKALRGELNPAENGWTNLQSRAGFPGGGMGGPGGPFGGGPFGAATGNQPARLSLEIQGKDLSFAVLAFDRYAQARVVPEDGTAATINLTLQQAPVPDAVAQLAKKAHRSWTTLYALQGGGSGPGGRGGPGFNVGFRDPGGRGPTDGPGGPPQFAARGPDGADRRGPGGRDVTDEQREEMRQRRAALEEELKQALPVAERQKLEQAQAEREQMMQEMQSLTPEQRMQRFSQMGGGNMDKMNRDRILNSTPEQRARMGPGPGRPGAPGRGGPGGPTR